MAWRLAAHHSSSCTRYTASNRQQRGKFKLGLLLWTISRRVAPDGGPVDHVRSCVRGAAVPRPRFAHISRAATTQREIEALADPVTIDLSGVEKVDTVGAWLIYRTVRDRGAKVIGASKDVASLLDQVAKQTIR
jgi:hypothetical protein